MTNEETWLCLLMKKDQHQLLHQLYQTAYSQLSKKKYNSQPAIVILIQGCK